MPVDTMHVLYTRHVTGAGRVRYTAAGVDCGAMKPGVWLVRDTGGSHAESWVAAVCPVPEAIHAACLGTLREPLARDLYHMRAGSTSTIELADYVLESLRRHCPPVTVAGRTTRYHVCAGCGRPVDRIRR